MKNRLTPLFVLLLGAAALSYRSAQDALPQETWEVPEKYQKMKNPYAGDPDNDRIGQDLYNQYCTSCHGKKGQGDGPNAGLTDVPVKDFTEPSFKEQADGSVYYKLIKGRGIMPPFESLIDYEEDRWLLVNYIKKF